MPKHGSFGPIVRVDNADVLHLWGFNPQFVYSHDLGSPVAHIMCNNIAWNQFPMHFICRPSILLSKLYVRQWSLQRISFQLRDNSSQKVFWVFVQIRLSIIQNSTLIKGNKTPIQSQGLFIIKYIQGWKFIIWNELSVIHGIWLFNKSSMLR